MGYLICDECNGYYELKPGETIVDFENCDCGGKLRYAETIDGVSPKYKQTKDICPKCGVENPAGATFCASCGSEMKKEPKSQAPLSGIFDWWDKQEKSTKTVFSIIGICCLGLLVIIAIGAMASPDKNTQNTTTNTSNSDPNIYSDSLLSFRIPTGFTVNQQSKDGHSIINHGDKEFYIDVISSSEQDEINAIYADGFYLDNDAAKTSSGDTYKIFKPIGGGDALVYLINKNGKLIEIVGHQGYGVDMTNLINTVQ